MHLWTLIILAIVQIIWGIFIWKKYGFFGFINSILFAMLNAYLVTVDKIIIG